MRVIGCTVEGVHDSTTLLVYAQAMSKVVLNISKTDEPWEDFIYPIHAGECLTAGCISTVARNVSKPKLVAVGPAFDWPAAGGRNDTVFVQVANGYKPVIQRILPPSLNAVNASDFIEETFLDIEGTFAYTKNGLFVNHNGVIYYTDYLEYLSVALCSKSSNLGGQCTQGGRNYSLGGLKPFLCSADEVASSAISFTSLGSLWISPKTNAVYVVDDGWEYFIR